jgi:hypothetical protein
MIVPETLERIATAASGLNVLDDDTLVQLKQSWPDLRFTLCNDDDMPARMKPAVASDKFNLYLISGSEHCLSLTDDPLTAIGVVVALVDEEG